MELFIIDDWEDMEDAITDGDPEIIGIVCKVVKKAVKRNFKKVTMFSVAFRDEPEFAYDWILERDQYKPMLENILQIYSDREMYEECIDVKKTLDSLV